MRIGAHSGRGGRRAIAKLPAEPWARMTRAVHRSTDIPVRVTVKPPREFARTVAEAPVEEVTFKQQSDKCVAAGKQPIQLVDYPDIPAGARLIQNERADILMSDLGTTSSLVKESPDQYDLGFTIFTDFKVGPAVQKGNPDLLKALYDGLKVQ